MNTEQKRILEHLEQLEEVGELIMAKNQECVELDKARQRMREAVHAMRVPASPNKMDRKSSDTQWVCLSDQMFKLPREKIMKAFDADLKTYGAEIQRLKSQQKEDVNWLRELEGKESLKGFDLIALSNDDI